MAGGYHPILQLDQLALQAQQLAEIDLPAERAVLVVGFFQAVIELEFELLVHRVQQVFAQAANVVFQGRDFFGHAVYLSSHLGVRM